MNLERYIASHIIFHKSKASEKDKSKETKPIINIAVGGITAGLVIMLVSIGILNGFQAEIRQKVIGFGSHVVISSIHQQSGFELEPIDKKQPFLDPIKQRPEVQSVQCFAQKPGILKSGVDVKGIVLKGVSPDYDWNFFQKNLVAGSIMRLSNETRTDSVLISERIAKKMRLQVGDPFFVYFFRNKTPKPRKFFISGIYHSGMETFDDKMIIGDIQHVQKINKWSKNQVGGFEINLKQYNDLFEMSDWIYEATPFEFKSETIVEKHLDIFSWLNLQDTHVIIIITLMILVSAINMTTALLILILNKTNLIGILKALGATNWSIRKVFLYNAAYLIGIGLFWGNVIGLGLCFIQDHFEIIKLEQETYYIDHVPILFNWTHIALLNIGTLVLCTFMLIIPSWMVTRISPTKAIKFQ